jgi:hypothetical protein
MLVCFDFAPIYHGRQQHGDGANKKGGEIQPAARIRRLILHKRKELPDKRSAVILQNCTKYQTRAAEDPFTTTTKSAAAHEAGGPQLFCWQGWVIDSTRGLLSPPELGGWESLSSGLVD